MCRSFINFLLGSHRRACVLCDQMNPSTENQWVFLPSIVFLLTLLFAYSFSFQAIRGDYFKADWAISYSVEFKAKAQVLYKEMSNVKGTKVNSGGLLGNQR